MSTKLNHARVLFVGSSSGIALANAVMLLVKTPFATGSTVRVDGGGAIA
jgi:hypothetical protein